MKKRITALLCICLMLCTLLPMSASADYAIDKVLCTTSYIPVAHANSNDIYASTSTPGCYIESYTWRETATGYIVYQLFPTGNVEVEITLRANEGWYFSDSVAVYLNNSSVNYYLGEGGSTLTLTRTYAPELWQPSVIKNPSNEVVDEGGLASFVATATVTENYSWYIVDPDSGKSYPGAEVPAMFEGSSIGSNREGQFNIYNVPAAMDGWQVYCVFSGPGGEAKSQKANIKVNYETPPPGEEEEPEQDTEAEPEDTAEEELPAPENIQEPENSPEPGHAHTFTAEWKHNEALHWRECSCGAMADEGVHSLVWQTQREASKREDGLSVGECEACGYRAEKKLIYNSANNVLRNIILGLGGLVALTIVVLMIDAIAANRRRRRRRKNRRR